MSDVNKEQLIDRLICGRNDEIDNASMDVVSALAAGKDDKECTAAVECLIDTLLSEDSAEGKEKWKKEGADPGKVLGDVREGLKQQDIKPTEEWDMYVIGDVTQIVEDILNDIKAPVCHPYYDGEEELCCLTADVCKWCTHKPTD